MDKNHALIRTSPKGGPFIGNCIKCGMTGLSSLDSSHCNNTMNYTQDETLLRVLDIANDSEPVKPKELLVKGVGRKSDDSEYKHSTVEVYMNRDYTDDELREFHDYIRRFHEKEIWP